MSIHNKVPPVNIFASKALVDQTWTRDIRLCVTEGMISEISVGAAPMPGDYRVDALLPALSNLHSHSFQRAMAGMTEFRTRGQDSFWTWRDLMYRFLDALTPDQVRAIAKLAFMEMLKAGYAAVGEFHYLHHQRDGSPYGDLAELSFQIMQAAQGTGIGLTHLPVLYSYGDVGAQPISAGQRRFFNDGDRFQRLVEDCRGAAREMPFDMQIGIAPHSLRATCPEDMEQVLQRNPDGPVHMHIAEQSKEVAGVIKVLGARPVEWLLENMQVDERWCLVHATHMTAAETKALAASGAVAGICPVTEANLGDGIFNGVSYVAGNGAFGVGTDSNINISLTDELRSLEYSQRLKHHQRNVLSGPIGSTGEAIYLNCAKGGAQALARNAGRISVGRLADLVAIDTNHPRLCTLKDSQLVDGWVFAANDQVVTDVWAAGRHMVKDGRHVDQDAIFAGYRTAMKAVTAKM
jgi:formiminoglutamate deiminase